MDDLEKSMEERMASVEVMIAKTLDCMLLAAEQYIEELHRHHTGLGEEFMEEELDRVSARFNEVRDKLAVEYIARFNSEIFYNAVENIPLYPTKLPTILDDNKFLDNREGYVEQFYGKKLGFL